MELTREPELRFSWRTPSYIRAPVFIIVCGDTRTKDAYPLNTALQRGSPTFMSSLAGAFLYMTLAATTLGLAAQWVSVVATHYVQSLTKDLLGVPKELEIYDMMAMGFPDLEPRSRLLRAKEEMVHYDYYDQTKFRTEQEVKEFIASLRRR